MLPFVKFFVALTFNILLIVLLSRPLTSSLPPIGPLINPFSGIWTLAEPVSKPPNHTITTGQIDSSFTIYMDKRMVPHVYAHHSKDAFFAQGFLHAKNRLFQMDLTQRAVQGRLSEILGEQTLEKDRFARRINFPLAIQNKVKSWEKHPDMMNIINAYIEGVNEYIQRIDTKTLPLEYKLLNIVPELWTLEKVAAISISLAATLNIDLRDFEHTNAKTVLGEDLYFHLFPKYPRQFRPIIPQSWPIEVLSMSHHSLPNFYPDVDIDEDYHSEEISGSNNWAVNGNRSELGYPMLANDPHLSLNLPSIWYEVHLIGPQLNCYGVSIPGMPGIVIGFNESMAWGLTNASWDVLDTYTINWQDDQQLTYKVEDQIKTAERRLEKIKIKNKQAWIEEVFDTDWGPILYKDTTGIRQDVAVQWLSSQESNICDFRTFYELMHAQDYTDYEAAIQNFYIPGQNIIYADVNDTIALTVQGKFPIKKPFQGQFIQSGNDLSNQWQGYIPFEELPKSVNPASQYLISANEWPTDSTYPYPYTGHFNHYRGRAIDTLINQKEKINMDDMKSIQNNVLNLKAKESVTVLLSQLSDMHHPYLDSLRHWDFEYRAQSPWPSLVEKWLSVLQRLCYDELGGKSPIAYPQVWRTIELINQHPHDTIFDLKSSKNIIESATDIVKQSWQLTIEEFEKQPLTEWQWGKKEGLTIQHLLQISPLGHEPLMTGGDGNTIMAATKTKGPSWKMIVALEKDNVHASVIYPGGQSGNPGSPYYDNFIQPWFQHEYFSINLPQVTQNMPVKHFQVLQFIKK